MQSQAGYIWGEVFYTIVPGGKSTICNPNPNTHPGPTVNPPQFFSQAHGHAHGHGGVLASSKSPPCGFNSIDFSLFRVVVTTTISCGCHTSLYRHLLGRQTSSLVVIIIVIIVVTINLPPASHAHISLVV